MSGAADIAPKVLLTGASGFVGLHAAAALSKAGAELHLSSRSKPSFDMGQWHQADLLSEDAAGRLIEQVRPDIILHTAWCVEHGRFWTDLANLDWVAATLHLVRVAAESGVSRFVGVGTCYEYDWPADGVCDEARTPLVGHTLYDISKDAVRRVAQAICREQKMRFAWGRLFFLYGMGEAETRLVPSVARALVHGRRAPLSRGTAIRDFMDVRDAGAALSALALSSVEGEVNIGTGQAISVADIGTKLGELAGRPDLIELGALPDREGEPPSIIAATGRLINEVAFTPSFSIDQGLQDALGFWVAAAGGDGPRSWHV